MKSVLIVAVVVFVCANTYYAHQQKCAGVLVNGKFHRKEIIANGLNRPYQLALDRSKHTLYFSYNVNDDDKDAFEIGYLKHKDKQPTPIPAVKNGFATALDEDNKLLYLGGSDGIFVLNLTNPGDVKHVIRGRDIWHMFFKDHLYFITYPSFRLHKKMNYNDSEPVDNITESIYQFAIDGDENMFITTKGGLHVIKNGTNERIPFDGPTQFRAVKIDQKGVAHFCADNYIYVEGGNHTLEKIAHVKNIFGITFDNDNNIIYSDPHEIVKLLPHGCK